MSSNPNYKICRYVELWNIVFFTANWQRKCGHVVVGVQIETSYGGFYDGCMGSTNVKYRFS